MMEFKKGDKVKCIKEKCANFGSLTYGNIYTVHDVIDYGDGEVFLSIRENGNTYFSFRFVKASLKPVKLKDML